MLEEKGLQGYGNKLLSFSKKEHKGEEVLKLNPRGQVRVTRPVQTAPVIMCRYRSSVEGKGWGGVAGEVVYAVSKFACKLDTEQKDVIYYSASMFLPRPAAGRPHTVTELRKKNCIIIGSATFQSLGIASFGLKSA